MKEISPTELRSNIYRILDQIAETGQAIRIRRKGYVLELTPIREQTKLDSKSVNKLERFRKYKGTQAIVGDPEDLVHIDWSSEWNPTQL